ncbi:hypothetical protein [Pseudomonas sp. A-R-26]|uniref:hypothetical protein n=1 Tax=Pseudomonas sp. A-R-26 TaxID=2832404 RepID=UPI001CBCAA66|nr:hypothetical protein [Pseudomonas sp. A-R-26]
MLDMDARKLTAFFRNNFVSLLIVSIGFAGFGYKLWEVHQAQEYEAKVLASKLVAINDLMVVFEKDKASVAVEQAKRDLELQKREFLVGRAESEVAKQQLDIAYREKTVIESTQQLKTVQQSLSKEQQVADAEDRIQKVIFEFSELGVNLNDNYRCLDGGPLRRYNSAKAKFLQIYSLVKANSLDAKYVDFIRQNMPQKDWYGC